MAVPCSPRHPRVLANKNAHSNIGYWIDSHLVANGAAFLGCPFLHLVDLGYIFCFTFIGLLKKFFQQTELNMKHVQ